MRFDSIKGFLQKIKRFQNPDEDELYPDDESEEDEACDTPCIVSFSYGYLTKIQPENVRNYYDADILISNGLRYNLNDPMEVKRIKTPHPWYLQSGIPDVTKSLDYVLRMKAGNAFNEENWQLCSALLWKSTELMLSNQSVDWSGRDYRRIIYWHYQMNMPLEAEKAKHYLEESPRYVSVRSITETFDTNAKASMDAILRQARMKNYDYVFFDDGGKACCEKCEEKIGRVYSISGTSLRYKPLPVYAMTHGNFHPGCRCICHQLFESNPKTVLRHGRSVIASVSSKRPYEDLRTDEQKAQYENYIQTITKKQAEEDQELEYSIQKGKRLALFQKCKEHCPELTPDTLTGFSRIKTQKTKRYLQIVEVMKQKGFDIENL